jgi:hypothetical protein
MDYSTDNKAQYVLLSVILGVGSILRDERDSDRGGGGERDCWSEDFPVGNFLSGCFAREFQGPKCFWCACWGQAVSGFVCFSGSEGGRGPSCKSGTDGLQSVSRLLERRLEGCMAGLQGRQFRTEHGDLGVRVGVEVDRTVS